jgi:hypothetical protein
MIGTDWTGGCKSNYHTITTTPSYKFDNAKINVAELNVTLYTLYYLLYHPYLNFVNINYRNLPFVSLRTSFVYISVLKLIIKINATRHERDSNSQL